MSDVSQLKNEIYKQDVSEDLQKSWGEFFAKILDLVSKYADAYLSQFKELENLQKPAPESAAATFDPKDQQGVTSMFKKGSSSSPVILEEGYHK